MLAKMALSLSFQAGFKANFAQNRVIFVVTLSRALYILNILRNHVYSSSDDRVCYQRNLFQVKLCLCFQDLKVKTCVLNQDSAVQLSKTSLDADHVALAIGQLHKLTDILSEDYRYPFVWSVEPL